LYNNGNYNDLVFQRNSYTAIIKKYTISSITLYKKLRNKINNRKNTLENYFLKM